MDDVGSKLTDRARHSMSTSLAVGFAKMSSHSDGGVKDFQAVKRGKVAESSLWDEACTAATHLAAAATSVLLLCWLPLLMLLMYLNDTQNMHLP